MDSSIRDRLTPFQQGLDLTTIYHKTPHENVVIIEDTDVNDIKVVSWNIGRGYDREGILSFITEAQPDVVLIQEADWGNERTNNRDVIQEIADALGFNAVFAIEFFEIPSQLRGKKRRGGGVHGNAILSRYPLSHIQRIPLPELYSWNNPRNPFYLSAFTEKRFGSRCALTATIHCKNKEISVVSTHFEDKAGGAEGRLYQFNSLLESFTDDEQPLIIGGDFNTHVNFLSVVLGIERRAGKRSRNIFLPECAWWKSYILPPLHFFEAHRCDETTFSLGPFSWKLDWLLGRNIAVTSSSVGKTSASDHKPLVAQFHLISVDK